MGDKEELELVVLQTSLTWEDPDRNRQDLEEKIFSEVKKADLIILPEMFSTGFTMNAKDVAEEPGGETLEWMRKISKTTNSAITGSIIVEEQKNFYNRLYFVLPNGEFHSYDKRHTFTFAGEHKVFSAGREKLIVNYKGWKICPLICYDLRFPVWCRNVEDYDLLIFVANWPQKRMLAWDSLLKARAIENMAYVVGCNRIGEDGNGVKYSGHSQIYDSLGESMAHFENGKEQILKTTLKKAELHDVRSSFKFLNDRDEFTLK